jgi:hypothetical protein
VARDEGDGREARRLYRESLDGWQLLDDRWGLSYWLEDVALLHVREQAVDRAFTLIGAADALRDAIGNPRPPAYAAKLEARLAPAAALLGAEDRAAARAAGRGLTLDDAIGQAIGDG